MGSKKRLAKQLWDTIKKNVKVNKNTCFVDLFCGGCGMVSQVPLKNRIANDLSTPLISYLKRIVKDTSWMPTENFLSKEKYNYIKRNQHLYDPSFLGYIGYNFSYAGSYFQGFCEKDNAKSNLALRTLKTAKKDAETLKGVEFFNTDYRNVPIPPKSIVYCDIPYKGTAKYNAIEGEFDYDAFFEYVKKLRADGHYVFISEYSDEVPEGVIEVGAFERKSNMRNGGKSRLGKKFGKYEKFKKVSK